MNPDYEGRHRADRAVDSPATVCAPRHRRAQRPSILTLEDAAAICHVPANIRALGR